MITIYYYVLRKRTGYYKYIQEHDEPEHKKVQKIYQRSLRYKNKKTGE